MTKKNFVPGRLVWVVERDEDACPVGVVGYLFLCVAGSAVIVTSKISGLHTLEEVMDYHIEETRRNDCTDLSVYPLRDCYASQAEARTVIEAEMEDGDE